MTSVTLARGASSVTLPLLTERGESPLSTDVGKPESGQSSKGLINPRWSDHWSQQRVHTINARLVGDSAYADALLLADIIKSHSGGDALTIDSSLPEIDGPVDVAPTPTASPLSIAYDPGRRDQVDVQLSVFRVQQTSGEAFQPGATPRAAGDGPLTISDGDVEIALERNIVVERQIGRPNSVVRRSTGQFPSYEDKRKAASDVFDVAMELDEDAAIALLEMVGQPLGRGALELDFNGLFDMGSFDVVVDGSQAVRFVRQSGREGDVIVPNCNFRVVTA